jgi:hypothetical protein
MEKQEKKIELETMRVVVKKMREDFMILIADISNMDDEVKTAHMLFSDAILQEMWLPWAMVTACAVTIARQTTLGMMTHDNARGSGCYTSGVCDLIRCIFGMMYSFSPPMRLLTARTIHIAELEH